VMRQLEHQMAQEAAELPHLLHEREALVGASSASTHAYAHARL
jgi:hypothetical protein